MSAVNGGLYVAPLLERTDEDGSTILEPVVPESGAIVFGRSALLWLPDGYEGQHAGALVKVADDLRDTMGDDNLSRMGNALLCADPIRGRSRRTGARHTLAQVLAELLFEHRNDQWGKLLLGVHTEAHDRFEILLGGRLVWEQLQPAAKHSVTLTETWPTHAPTNITGGTEVYDWDSIGGFVLNAVAAAGTPNTAYIRQNTQDTAAAMNNCVTPVDTVNHEVTAPIEIIGATTRNQDVYLGVRYQGSGNDAGYRGRLRHNTTWGASQHAIQRRGGAGGSTALASFGGDPGASQYQGTVRFNGSTLSWIFGAITGNVTATDATLDAYLRCAVGMSNPAGANVDDTRIHASVVMSDISTNRSAGTQRGVGRGIKRGVGRGLA